MSDWLILVLYILALLGAAGFSYAFAYLLMRAFTEIGR